jgi:spore maturation protein CgeB
MIVLLLLGKHNYGNPERGVGIEYDAFTNAIRNLGHEAHHFEIWDRACYKDFYELNRALLAEVNRLRPNIIIAVPMHYELWNETLDIIRSWGDVATICWATDDSWKYSKSSKYIGHHYSAMSTTYDYVIPQYHKDGIEKVLLTQWAANTKYLHHPKPASECVHLVSFVGQAHGNRKAKVKKLAKLGFNVDCYGHGWPVGSVALHEIPNIINESVISLNFANSYGLNQIKARTFEVPASGGFLMTEYAPGLEDFYEIGKEIVIFENLKDLASKIRYYISHPEDRDSIATAGFERTKNEHTYEKRLDKVIKFALDANNNRLSSNIEPRFVDLDSLSRSYSRNRKLLEITRKALECSLAICFGRVRAPRAARRLVFEMSVLLQREKAYSASGLPGRMFPDI